MNPILGSKDNNQNNINNHYNSMNYNYNPQSYYNSKKNNKYNNSKKANITAIIRIFAILIMIFGISLIGQSAYALNSEENKQKDNPQVTTEKMGKEVTISIVTERPIKEFRYRWNEGEDSIVAGNGTVKAEKTIDVPNGNNILKITVTDYFGNKTQYNKQYIYESSDIEKPSIEIAVTGNKLKITAKDETKISYMAYRWNEDTETRIDANEEEKEISQEIEVKEGANDLTIIAVDGEENKTTRAEKIIGDTKPEIYITTEGDNIVITAKDDEEVSKIEVDVDGQLLDSGEESLKQKEVTAKLQIGVGTHTVRVTVTNINGLQTSKEVTASL